MYTKWILILLATYIGRVEAADGDMYCESTPVREGENALIKVHFGKDISKLQSDINIVIHHTEMSNNNSKKTELHITWFGGSPSVNPSPSVFTLEDNVTNTLKLLIIEAKRELSGNFSCFYVNNDKHMQCTCQVQVLARPQDEKQSKAIITGVIVVCCILVLIVLFAIFIHRKLRPHQRFACKCLTIKPKAAKQQNLPLVPKTSHIHNNPSSTHST